MTRLLNYIFFQPLLLLWRQENIFKFIGKVLLKHVEIISQFLEEILLYFIDIFLISKIPKTSYL